MSSPSLPHPLPLGHGRHGRHGRLPLAPPVPDADDPDAAAARGARRLQRHGLGPRRYAAGGEGTVPTPGEATRSERKMGRWDVEDGGWLDGYWWIGG